jgi:oxalate decarboxylase
MVLHVEGQGPHHRGQLACAHAARRTSEELQDVGKQTAKAPAEGALHLSAPKPGALFEDRNEGSGPVPHTFSHRLLQQGPKRVAGGSVRIADSTNFPASKTIAAALVELDPRALRELHWHPNADEWQYYIEGEGRMTVFGSESKARTFDYRAGDVGYVPFAMGHYIENTGSGPPRFLEMFRSEHYADLSLNQWLALTPRVLFDAHLKVDADILAGL